MYYICVYITYTLYLYYIHINIFAYYIYVCICAYIIYKHIVYMICRKICKVNIICL